ncbi:hypothetical protein ACW0JT_09080 [Arthrobacter sp. SA17]
MREKVPRPESTPGFIVEALFSESLGDEPVRMPVEVHSGGGGKGRWDIGYWFSLPEALPAEIGLAVTWPGAGIEPTVLRIAREDILKAAPRELSFPANGNGNGNPCAVVDRHAGDIRGDEGFLI